MILNIYADSSYLSELNDGSHAPDNFFLGWMPVTNKPIKLNGTVHTLCKILKFVATSAVEVELRALFMNIKQGQIMRLTLE